MTPSFGLVLVCCYSRLFSFFVCTITFSLHLGVSNLNFCPFFFDFLEVADIHECAIEVSVLSFHSGSKLLRICGCDHEVLGAAPRLCAPGLCGSDSTERDWRVWMSRGHLSESGTRCRLLRMEFVERELIVSG